MTARWLAHSVFPPYFSAINVVVAWNPNYFFSITIATFNWHDNINLALLSQEVLLAVNLHHCRHMCLRLLALRAAPTSLITPFWISDWDKPMTKLHLLPREKTKTKVQAKYERYRAEADSFICFTMTVVFLNLWSGRLELQDVSLFFAFLRDFNFTFLL
jgi:hypothetical protein